MAGDDLFLHLRTLDLARRLRMDLDSLADSRPEVADAVPGVATYLADLIADDPEAAVILRAEQGRPLTARLLAAQARRVAS